MNEPGTTTDCEHHWVSIHQPDFPPGLYWIGRCSICGWLRPEIQDGWSLTPPPPRRPDPLRNAER